MRRAIVWIGIAGFLCVGLMGLSPAADDNNPAYTNEKDAGPDFAVQGEYVGKLGGKDYGAQVVALGDGKFEAYILTGGLPGAGWKKGDERKKVNGKSADGVVSFADEKVSAKIQDGKLTVSDSGGTVLGTLTRTVRKSPTLGAKPPEGAVVLFDGSSKDNFEGGKLTEDKLLMVAGNIKSKQSFKNYTLHIEFRSPFMPKSSGQGRGNSGVYFQNRYEMQVLDSFGLEGKNNECGGLYSVAEPNVNMCLPPLSWQTYDVEFTAAVYDGDGNKTKNAKATVKHNGVVIHDNMELKHTPGGDPNEAPGIGPLMLQDHSNPVCFRNIWIVEKK